MRALSMALKWMSLNRHTTLYVSGRVFSLRTQTQVVRNALLTVRLVCPLFTLCSCEDVKAIYPRVRSPKPDWIGRDLPFTTGAFGSRPVYGVVAVCCIDRAFRLYPQDSPKQAGTSGAVIMQYACVRPGHARNCAKIFIDGAYLAVGHVLVHGPRHDLQ